MFKWFSDISSDYFMLKHILDVLMDAVQDAEATYFIKYSNDYLDPQ